MQQDQAFNLLKMGKNIFLTGAAGSGKTYLLNKYINYLKKNNVPVAITASTGIAATHLQGTTIHSWSGIGVKDTLTQKDLEKLFKASHIKRNYKQTKVLIIDEISMLHKHQLEMVDSIARFILGNDKPFGGIQIILCGDFFQLPPVSSDPLIKEKQFAFEASSWINGDFHVCYLQEQHRQGNDPLLDILNDIRAGTAGEHTKVPLRTRYKKEPQGATRATKLYSRNINVDVINERELTRIDSQEKTFTMSTAGFGALVEGLKKSCLAPLQLKLKIGAEAMFIKNDGSGRYVNGTRCVVVGFDEEDGDWPIVKTYDNKTIIAQPETWKYEDNGLVHASITQVPLRLAWAITIHKSQGMTLDAAEIDLGDAFEPGMGYVALSRVRSLTGLKLMNLNEMALKVHPKILQQDKIFKDDSAAVIKSLQALSEKEIADYHKKLLIEFSKGSKSQPLSIGSSKPKKTKKNSTYLTTLVMLNEYSSIESIAAQRQCSIGTIISHIEKLKELQLIDNTLIQNLKHELSESDFNTLIAELELSADGKLKPIYDKFSGKYSYSSIRLVRLFAISNAGTIGEARAKLPIKTVLSTIFFVSGYNASANVNAGLRDLMSIRKMKQTKKIKPNVTGWNTTDLEEVERRQLRGQLETFQIKNTNADRPYFSSFLVNTTHNKQYYVEIRSLSDPVNSCDCPDYRGNQLGTCKHIEHILFRLRKSRATPFKQALSTGSPYAEIYFDTRRSCICIQQPKHAKRSIRHLIDAYFSTDGTLLGSLVSSYASLQETLVRSGKTAKKSIRVSRHIDYMVENQQQLSQKLVAKEVFLKDVSLNKITLDILKFPLYPYQREGMLHLAFNERAMLADEMGLGKTIQAVAACELLRRYKNIKRVLVVATASLKAEWEEQITKFTGLTSIIIQGSRAERLQQYQRPAFFYLMNYEQVVIDGPDVQRLLSPDVIILDEAQRIKNWQTRTANAVKQLKSRYAFVLTGTPLENRIDDLYSVIQFLDPHILGPLFRFNRDFYKLDEKGKPIGYQNLNILHQRIRPIMLRRCKSDVEEQLPKRTVNNYFIKMDEEQRTRYDEYKERVARLVSAAKRRPLRKEEFEKMQKWLACMRMLCDTPFILDPHCQVSPKLDELNTILDELLTDDSAKIIIFSEWEKMLQLVRNLARQKKIDAAWHTGSVPQHKRREDINRFKNNPDCRLFLSTDSGSVGLNLQSANIVINIDLPWNPAKLEQRIARAWRKHQVRTVRVINLISEDSIEHRMLGLLAQKQTLAQGVLEGKDDLKEMMLPSGRAAFLERMESLMASSDRVNLPAPITNTSIKTLSSTMRNKIDLLQSSHTNSNQHTIMAVIDESSDEMRSQLRQAFMSEAVTLEMLDRNTFDVIRRLEKAGFLTLNHSVETLHVSDKFSVITKQLHEKQLSNAKKHLDIASRRQRMAQLLIEGEFTHEALASLRDALAATIHSFAWLTGVSENEMKETLSHHYIQKNLIEKRGLHANAASLFSRLSHHNNDAQAKELLDECQEIYGHINDKLTCFHASAAAN